MVNDQVLKLLLVEDNMTDANWIDCLLKENWHQSRVSHVNRVEEALDSLSHNDFDAILLDLCLPDSQGIESLTRVQQKAPQLPIVVLTGTDDPAIAIQSLRQGAQDYLIKGEFESKTLNRSIHFAIERQKSEFELRQQALMKAMLDKIRNSIDLATILDHTAQEIQQFLNTEQVIIYRRPLHAFETKTLFSASVNHQSTEFSINQFMSALGVNSLEALVSHSTVVRAIEAQKYHCASNSSESATQIANSYLILPIWLQESTEGLYEELPHALLNQNQTPDKSELELWGVLIAYNNQSTRKWQDWEINFLQTLTSQVTIAIQQSQLCCRLQTANQKLQQLAILDGLTGIANRRYFDLVLENEWQRLAREQKPLSLILCDVDHFKAYNDFYGHQQGDRCLQKIAQILARSTRRPADLAARYGGEEFAIVLPNTDGEGALHIARNIQQQLKEQQLVHQGSTVSDRVTCSMGIATTIPQGKQSIKELIEQSDRLLYQAKRTGRNQIISSVTDLLPQIVEQ